MNSPDAQELAGKYLETLEERVHWPWEVNKVRLQGVALHVRDTPHEVTVFQNKILRELWGTRPAVVYKGGVPWYNKLKGISYSVFKDKRLRPLIVFEDTVEDALLREEL